MTSNERRRHLLVVLIISVVAVLAWAYERNSRLNAEATLAFYESVVGVTGGALLDPRQACSNPVDHASPQYIAWCLKYAPDVSPACVGARNSPRGVGGGPMYLEVLDCSWHAGKNPRDKKSER
jgi:hypothetical protein